VGLVVKAARIHQFRFDGPAASEATSQGLMNLESWAFYQANKKHGAILKKTYTRELKV
jgi:hypothetical protein